jgi:hypothetical protein
MQKTQRFVQTNTVSIATLDNLSEHTGLLYCVCTRIPVVYWKLLKARLLLLLKHNATDCSTPGRGLAAGPTAQDTTWECLDESPPFCSSAQLLQSTLFSNKATTTMAQFICHDDNDDLVVVYNNDIDFGPFLGLGHPQQLYRYRINNTIRSIKSK